MVLANSQVAVLNSFGPLANELCPPDSAASDCSRFTPAASSTAIPMQSTRTRPSTPLISASTDMRGGIMSIGDHQQYPAPVLGDAVQVSGGEGNRIQQGRARLRLDVRDRLFQQLVVARQVLLKLRLIAVSHHKDLVILPQMPHQIAQGKDNRIAVLRRQPRLLNQDSQR